MREQLIKVKPFEFLNILEYTGIQILNEHGVVAISGHISEQAQKDYIRMLLGEVWAEVIIFDEAGKEKEIFCGLVTNASIYDQNNVIVLYLEIKTGTYLMDIKEHIRTYQNKSCSYENILKSFIKNYEEGGVIGVENIEVPIKKFICQYLETDWDFAKRLASNLNTVLVANHLGKGVKYFLGVPNRDTVEFIESEYQMKWQNGILCYIIKSREIQSLGDNIIFQERLMSIVKIETELYHGELLHKYYLVTSNSIKTKEIFNQKLIGASLYASVLSVEKDRLRVIIAEDENAKASEACSFSYATVYSSPNGAGWYCMPEPGDSVRLYFPTKQEEEAYVISSINLNSSNKGDRSNPDYKSIKNKQGKEVRLTPTSIVMTNNMGMSVEILDEEGIKIISNKAIIMKSEEEINLSSTNSKVELFALNSIIMQQGSTQMALSERMMMKGAKVNLN